MSLLSLQVILAIFWVLLAYNNALNETENLSKGNIFLDDGILIRELGKIQRVGALHSLIISIEKPLPPNLRGWYNYFMRYLGTSKAEIMPSSVRAKITDRLQRLIRFNRIHQVSGQVDFLGHVTPTDSTVNDEQGGSDLDSILVSTLHSCKSDKSKLTGFKSKCNTDFEPPFLLENVTLSHLDKRSKRGLVDGIGSIFNFLFGLAKETDIKMVKEQLNNLKVSEDVIHHNMGEMLSCFNVTRHNVAKIAATLQTLMDNVGTLKAINHAVIVEVSNLTTKVDRNYLEMILYQNLDMIQEIQDDYYYAHQLYKNAEHNFYRGFLTDTLLPIEHLENILANLRQLNFKTENVSWYYQHLRVKPIIITDGNLVFATAIPGAHLKDFNGYSFQYFPVGSSTGDLVRSINGRPLVALHAQSREWFVPASEQCVGVRPMMCAINKVSISDTCEMSILLSKLEGCKIQISRTPEVSFMIFHPPHSQNELVISSFKPLRLVYWCNGRNTKIIIVDGINKMIVEPECAIMDESATFRISSIKMMESRFKFQLFKEVKLPKLDIEWPSGSSMLQIPGFEESGSVTLEYADLPKFKSVPFFGPFRSKESKLYFIIGVLAGALVLLMVIITICRIFGRRAIIRKLKSWVCDLCKKKVKFLDPTTETAIVEGGGIQLPLTTLAEKGAQIFQTQFLHKITDPQVPSAPFTEISPVDTTSGLYPVVEITKM